MLMRDVLGQDVLLAEMAYFRSYLNGSESCDDIDISVHCDIQVHIARARAPLPPLSIAFSLPFFRPLPPLPLLFLSSLYDLTLH